MKSTSLQTDRVFPGNLGPIERRANESLSRRLVTAATGPEAIGLATFCAFGLLLTALFNLLVPNFAAVAASLQPYF